jgi:Ca-activated chloride channel family protein
VAGRHAAEKSSQRPYVIAGIAAIVLLVLVLATRFLFAGDGRPLLAQVGRDCVGLTVVSSPDKFELLRQLAADYVGTGPTVDGRCVQINVAAKESAPAAIALDGWNPAVDGPRPDVWSPSSTGWVGLMQAQRAADHLPDIVPPELPFVATTPLVLAMPKPVAEGLGWPRKQLTWTEALGLALRGWSSVGKPELGAFRMGASDAFVSTAGLSTLIGSSYAAAQYVTHKPIAPNLEVLRNEQVQRTLLGFDRAIKERAVSSAALLTKLKQAEQRDPRLVPRVMSALVVEEKTVLDYNQGTLGGEANGNGRQPPRVPLVATYPPDGTVLSDHPYVVLNTPWMDSAKRVAAGGFLEFIQSERGQAKFLQAGFRSHQGVAGPLATQDNGLLGDQKVKALPTPEPTVLGALVKAYSQNRKKGNLLSLIDVSGSMKELVPGTSSTRMDLALQAALGAVPLLSDEGDFGQWIFSTNMDGPRDWKQLIPLGRMGEEMKNGKTRRENTLALVGKIQATNGDTGLYDTTAAAVDYMRKRYKADRLNIVVLITDGHNDDPGGGLSLPQLLQTLRAQPEKLVRIVAIGYGPEADQAVLRQIASAGQGVAIEVRDPRDIQKAFIQALQRF